MLLKRVEEDIIQPSIGLFTDEAQQSTTFDGGIGANSAEYTLSEGKGTKLSQFVRATKPTIRIKDP